MTEMRKKILWITRTAVMIALLVTLQWGTGFTQAFAGQFITGSCVNAVLAVSVLFGGLGCGAVVALLSPFCAFLVGVGPAIVQVIPCIALGNLTFVLVLNTLNKESSKLWRQVVNVLVSAVGKCAFLYVAVVRAVLPAMSEVIKPQQAEKLSAMFSWPQLVTALIGGLIAIPVVKLLKKVFHKQ